MLGNYEIPSYIGTELSYSLFTLLALPALIPALFQLVRQDVIPLVLSLLEEEGLVVHTQSLLETLYKYITIPGITLTFDEINVILPQIYRLAKLPPTLENQYTLQMVVRIMQSLEHEVFLSLPLHSQASLHSLLKQAVSTNQDIRLNAMQQLKLKLPSGLFPRLEALFASQFAQLGREQWLPLLAFVLLDAVENGEIALADPSLLLPSLAYPLNREGEYEIMVHGQLQDWSVKREVIDFIQRVNQSLYAISACKPRTLLIALKDLVFLDSVITEKYTLQEG